MEKKNIKEVEFSRILPGGNSFQQYRNFGPQGPGWVRIARKSLGLGWPSAGILLITNRYSISRQEYLFVAISMPHSGSGAASIIHRTEEGVFGKLRFVRLSNSEQYLELNMSFANDIILTLSNAIGFELLPSAMEGNVPEGASVTEITI